MKTKDERPWGIKHRSQAYLFAVLGDHLELRDLVRVELQHLEEVVQQVPDEQLHYGWTLEGR